MGRFGFAEFIVITIIAGIVVFILKQNKKVSNIVLNKHYLQSQIKSSGTAYLLWFCFGLHYAYLGKWGVQFLYWITFGGIGIWALIDLFTLSGRVANHNALIFAAINNIEKMERESEHARNLEMILASKGI